VVVVVVLVVVVVAVVVIEKVNLQIFIYFALSPEPSFYTFPIH
jgi:hypothetical protein